MRWIRQTIRGAGYLEGYGHHPGWAILGIIILASGLAGIEKGGLNGFIGGMIIGGICTLPMFIAGCIGRANDCDRDQERIIHLLKKE